jgi:uncharacterized delta-60 repeat protein
MIRPRRSILAAALAVTTLVAASITGPVHARPSQPSEKFGTAGRVTYSYGEDSSVVASAMQGAGRTVVVFADTIGGVDRALVRSYRRNGSLDGDFGTGGVVDLGAGSSAASVAVGGDGSINVAGTISILGVRTVAIWRLTATGELDTTFSADGRAEPGAGSPVSEQTIHVALDTAERVVVIATTGLGTIVYRVLPTGIADPAFSADGRVAFVIGDANNLPRAVAVAPSGKVIVAGSFLSSNDPVDGIEVSTSIVRLRANGGFDTSFGDDGIASHAIGPGRLLDPTDVEVDGRGRIVVGGVRSFSAIEKLSGFVLRMRRDGALDTRFAGDGLRFIGYNGPFGSTIGTVDVQRDDKVLVSGEYACDRVGVARLTTRGRMDSTFSRDGVRTYRFGPGGESCVRGSDVTSTGARLVIVGSFSGISGGVGLLSINLR